MRLGNTASSWTKRELDFDDAALHSDDNRLRAVAHVQTPQNDIDVPLDGAASDVQRVGNLLIVESFYDEAEDVQFARAERGPVEFAGDAIADAAREVGVAGAHAADGFEQLQVRHSFKQVRLRAGGESLANVLIALICGEHDHGTFRALRPDHLGGLDA